MNPPAQRICAWRPLNGSRTLRLLRNPLNGTVGHLRLAHLTLDGKGAPEADGSGGIQGRGGADAVVAATAHNGDYLFVASADVFDGAEHIAQGIWGMCVVYVTNFVIKYRGFL